MKRILLCLVIVAFTLNACSVSKAVRDQRNLISGTWILEDVAYENNTGAFKAVLFNDADAICFEGSNWFFRDNNSTGRYTLESGSLCEGGDRSIRWSVVDNPENYKSQLQFKFIDEKRKDLNQGLGYRLLIDTLTAERMILKSNVSVDGERLTIVYKFSKQG